MDRKSCVDGNSRILRSSEYAESFITYRSEGVGPHERILYPLLLDFLDPLADCAVLDVGCGHGEFLTRIAQLPVRCLAGVDINPLLIEKAEARLSADVELVAADISEGLPFADDSFDRLVVGMVLLHLNRQQAEAVAAELARVMKVGAKAVVTVTHPAWASEMYNCQIAGPGETQAVREKSAVSWVEWYRGAGIYEELFTAAGLKVESQDVIVPNDSELGERYSSRVGKAIFNVFKLSK